MPQTMSTPRELLLHELGDIYYAENVMLKALPTMADEAQDDELRSGFEQHAEETRQQVENLRQAFEALGEPAAGERCPAIEGIKAEHDEFVRDHDTAPEIRDLFLTGSGGRTEHYEIAAYTSLITMADSLGEDKVVHLLKENLRQEQETLEKLETAGRRLAANGNA